MKSEQQSPISAPEWIAEAAEGELSHAQKSHLTDWLRESPRHVREFLELTLLREDLSTVPLTKTQVDAWVREARESAAIDISPAITSMAAGSAASAMSAANETASRNRRSQTWALAASITLAVTAIVGHHWWQDGRYSTGFGEQKILTLADGSVVTLNTSSELKVNFADDKRALQLVKGEAFFRVARDPSRPFEVSAPDATVKAIGTQFNVRIAPRETVVSVLDGAVEVRERSAVEKPLQLRKGEETRIDREGVVDPANPPLVVKAERTTALRAAAWTRGRVEFEATPLVDVLREFQRYRQFNVEVAEPIRGLKLTGSFDAQDPEAAFAYIATLPGVIVENPAPQTFVVRRK